MSSIEPNLVTLLFVSAAWMVFCFGAFLIAGMLPLQSAPAAIQTPSGVFLVLANAFLLAFLFILLGLLGYRELRWTSMVVAGGLIFLLSPFLVQDLPERLKNGKAGLVILLPLLVVTLAALLSRGAGSAIFD